MTNDNPPAPLEAVRVWDLPTRLFHWTLAACVVFSVVSATIGGNAMAWHFRSGYVVLTLLAFRLVWGLVGGRWSRFASFVYAPATIVRYLKGQSGPQEHHDVGHNPLGAFSVFALLAILIVQVATGLVADDDLGNTGPLVALVKSSTSSLATGWHKHWGQWIIIGLTVLHVAAIVAYARRGKNLVVPMLTGDKQLPRGVPAADDHWRARATALVLVAACAGAVAWLVKLGG